MFLKERIDIVGYHLGSIKLDNKTKNSITVQKEKKEVNGAERVTNMPKDRTKN